MRDFSAEELAGFMRERYERKSNDLSVWLSAATTALKILRPPAAEMPHKFTPTNGNLYRCSVCVQPSYDCTGERPESEGPIKRNTQDELMIAWTMPPPIHGEFICPCCPRRYRFWWDGAMWLFMEVSA